MGLRIIRERDAPDKVSWAANACKIATLRQEKRRLDKEVAKAEVAHTRLVIRRDKVAAELLDLTEGR